MIRKKKYSTSGSIAVVAFLAIAALYLFQQGPDLSRYDLLKEPRITKMQDQKMLQVAATGDPNLVSEKAFKLLFKTYYKIPGVSKKKQSPRARWTGDVNVKSAWTGYYALPVPAETASLPPINPEPGYQVQLATWEYGDVAEILHIGPYTQEAPTMQKLREFLKQQGYEIAGYHEEEYLEGPGTFSKGDPDKYMTIIRYRVKKRN